MEDRNETQADQDVFVLDFFRDDLSAALDAERGDVPDWDSLEAARPQPVARYTRRSL
jgi:hypothetical protein